ncbi:hypothetical protein PMAYCL1PPCAC_25931, partial [Pristionchus mayeri]
ELYGLCIMEDQDRAESCAHEELLKMEGELESFKLHVIRLENELASSKEIIQSARDENLDLLASVCALNQRIEQLTRLNRQLEYEKDLSSRLNGDSEEALESLQLRVLKAET